MLITLIFEYFLIKKANALNNSRATKLVLSKEEKTIVKRLGIMFIIGALNSEYEEVSTKVILNCHDAL